MTLDVLQQKFVILKLNSNFSAKKGHEKRDEWYLIESYFIQEYVDSMCCSSYQKFGLPRKGSLGHSTRHNLYDCNSFKQNGLFTLSLLVEGNFEYFRILSYFKSVAITTFSIVWYLFWLIYYPCIFPEWFLCPVLSTSSMRSWSQRFLSIDCRYQSE